jgi:endonuclease YncB( thermonuclease family)
MTALGSYEHRYRIKALVDFVDGDTLYLSVDQGFHDGNDKRDFRLAHIDAPEESSEHGKEARVWLIQRCQLAMMNNPTTFHVQSIVAPRSLTDKEDKYRRYLGILWDGDECINDEMVTDGYAKYWEGQGPHPT